MSVLIFEKYPATRWETIMSNGFRPLFLCVGLAGVILITAWMLMLSGVWQSMTMAMPVVQWHAHEMLYGFVGAAMGGFLLAAVSKWTGRMPVSGKPLVLLVSFWLLGRCAVGFSSMLPYPLVILLDMLYGILLAVLIGREILASGNQRNIKVVVILALFSLFNLLFHFGVMFDSQYSEMAIRGAMLQIAVMIALIGGRITPSFTGNYLRMKNPNDKQLPVQFNIADKVISILLGIAAVFWILLPENLVTGGLLIASGLGQWYRVSRWQGMKILSEPLLWILHMGFIWLGLGLVLLGLSVFGLVSVSGGQHAIGIGAMASMILGVASRAALGHTQRALVAGRLMTISFTLIGVAALSRVAATGVQGVGSMHLIYSAGVVWLVALILFCIRYIPILISPAPNWKRQD